MDDTESGRIVPGLPALAVVPLSVWVVRRSAAVNWIAWTLALPAIALSALSIGLGRPEPVTGAAMLESALHFYAAGSLIACMLADHRVTLDELLASGATSTLLAWGFACACSVCQAWYPGSFAGMVEPVRTRNLLELQFLSFSTLSGVGDGDILPVGPQARVLVMLEQVAGIGDIAIVVSRLVGMSLHRGGPEALRAPTCDGGCRPCRCVATGHVAATQGTGPGRAVRTPGGPGTAARGRCQDQSVRARARQRR